MELSIFNFEEKIKAVLLFFIKIIKRLYNKISIKK